LPDSFQDSLLAFPRYHLELTIKVSDSRIKFFYSMRTAPIVQLFNPVTHFRPDDSGRHCAGLPDIDTRSPDEIVGYDETGTWR